MRSKTFAWLATLAVATAGCLTTTAPDTSKQTIAAISGQVTRQDGTGVGGPLITISLLSAASGGTARLLSQGSVIGDGNGRFLFLFLITGEDPQDGSAIIEVTPPVASSLLPFDTTGVVVKLVQGRTATDTTHVQMMLQPR